MSDPKDQMAEMLRLTQEQAEATAAHTEAIKEQTKAELLAKQASDNAAREAARAAESQEELVKAVKNLIEGAGRLATGMTNIEEMPERLDMISQMLQMLITVIAGMGNVDKTRMEELQDKMAGLAELGAKRESKVHVGNEYNAESAGGSIVQGGNVDASTDKTENK